MRATFTGILLISVLSFERAESACRWSQWGAKSCPQGFQEVYKEGYYAKANWAKLCCNKPEEIDTNRVKVRECRNTECMPKSFENPCRPGTNFFMDRVTVEGERLENYVPVRNASCSMGNSRISGVGYTCCLPENDGMYLATALGTEYREFPHQVDLNGCGGTVYNKRWLLTAAHCVVEENGSITPLKDLKVTLGSDISGVYENDRRYTVEQVRVHEKYSQLRNHSFYGKNKYFNDIALIKVNKDIIFDENVKPLRIAAAGSDPSDNDNRLVIVGWGKTDTGFGSSFLQKATTPIRTYEQCYGTKRAPSVLDDRRRRDTYQMTADEFRKLFASGTIKVISSNTTSPEAQVPAAGIAYNAEIGNMESEETPSSGRSSEDGGRRQVSRPWVPWPQNAQFSDGIICIGGVINGTFGSLSFSGDSGGPAICRSRNGEAVLCGISSFGSPMRAKCAKSPSKENCPPSFYTRVSRYTGWITGVAGNQTESDLYKPYLFGRDTGRGEYKHQVHITSGAGKTLRKCGGTLIKGDKVITSAQCVVDQRKQRLPNLRIAVNVHDSSDFGEAYKITKVDVHDKYRRVQLPFKNQVATDFNRTSIEQQVYLNDIAIVTLERKVNNRRFPKIPAESSEPYSDMGIELSWRYNSRHSSVLQSREYKLLSQKECNDRLERMRNVGVQLKTDPSIICAVEKYSGASSCDRELGGGVICKDKRGRDVLCGIQSLRLCTMAFPNGFINPGHYTKWIKERLV